MLNKIKKLIDLDNPIRIFYHKCIAILASIFYLFPAKKVNIIGVTGTKGKTTTANLICHILNENNIKTGLISTMNIKIGKKETVNNYKMTTLPPFQLNKLIKSMVKQKCKFIVIETSSHSILYNRIWGIPYDMVVLTHITQDHLDLHKTIKNYVNTKKQLFKNLKGSYRKKGQKKIIILNSDDKYFDKFDKIDADIKYTYGKNENADFKFNNIRKLKNETQFNINSFKLKTKLLGDFNLENILASYTACYSLGIKREDIAKAIYTFDKISGRMEKIDIGQNFQVFVDYAHTPDSLDHVLNTISTMKYKNIRVIFGATGDREREKRPIMAKIVEKYAKFIYLTDDDTYTEDSTQIINDVKKGFKNMKKVVIIPNREKAIKLAIDEAEKDDIILIAGKGCENVLATNTGKIPWDDRKIAKKYINKKLKCK